MTDRQQKILKTKRNGEVELLRFIFAVIVFSYHFEYGNNIFKSGYLGVEFFFVLSGFLLMKHIESINYSGQRIPSILLQYLKGRIIRLYPSYFLACLLAYIIRSFVLHQISAKVIFDKGIWEFLLLQSFGFEFSTTVLWYVSALIISSVILYFFFLCFKEKFFPIICIVSFILLAFLFQQNQKLSSLNNHLVVSDGLLRGFAEMGLGCITYKIVQRITTRSKAVLRFLFIPKYLLFAVIIYFMTREPGIKDFSFLLLTIAFVALLFLDKSGIQNIYNNKFCRFLGSISYDFYLNQIIVIYLARMIPEYILRQNPILTFLSFVVAITILSLVTKKISGIISGKIMEKYK